MILNIHKVFMNIYGKLSKIFFFIQTRNTKPLQPLHEKNININRMVNEAFVVNDDDGDLSTIISNVTSKILNNDKSFGNESFSIDANLNHPLKGKKQLNSILFLNQILVSTVEPQKSKLI